MFFYSRDGAASILPGIYCGILKADAYAGFIPDRFRERAAAIYSLNVIGKLDEVDPRA
jgi:hypothetical protein